MRPTLLKLMTQPQNDGATDSHGGVPSTLLDDYEKRLGASDTLALRTSRSRAQGGGVAG